MSEALKKRFSDALDALVAQIKRDRSILAVILCGSLSHDTVWAKSDIDLVLVSVDDKKPASPGLSLYADGINVHASMIARADFRKTVEGGMRNSFMHSLLAKGRLLYTHDETIAGLCSQLHEIGERDTQVQLLSAATNALAPIYKAHKWFITRNDLDYVALWILYSATSLAKIEVMSARLLVDREVLPQALKLNPPFFQIIYSDLLNNPKTARDIGGALTAIDDYLRARIPILFGPLIEYMREIGEARSATEINEYFQRHFGIHGIDAACEYLSDQGILGKVHLPARLTKKSNVDVPELAFYHAR